MGTKPNYSERDGVLSVVCHNYHDGEYPFARMSQGAHVRDVWTTLTDDLLRACYGEDDEKSADFMFHAFLDEQLYGLEYDFDSLDRGEAIFVVSGRREGVFEAFVRYAATLRADVVAGGPGADDGTYDYFPGAVEVVLQLATAFIEIGYRPEAAKSTYNDLVAIARETHYSGNEEADDLLPLIP